MKVERYTGEGIRDVLSDLARLRVTVFRDFPYLYEGSPEYEASYLQTYLNTPESLAVVVPDGDRVVGASTAMPLSAETPDLQAPFQAGGYDVETIFYLAESVLQPEYRGRGLGITFFEEREAHARRLGRFRYAAFCAVQRPENHPRRPEGYVPLDAFWQKRGYTKRLELSTTLTWQDLDETAESPKPMTFWLKDLTRTAEERR
ncbi:GNAT family N-acetyltransferase [Deinococcus aerophilus]|uniref:GNAT family acetyltransferase n=1 Tax=Deinococcus aerophilus TaxID=522488 RepID=A0ABQ2H0U5_9DEIO|nr:GNAT family N-acetyltransferase [Deinococcus aerophilus]GGM20876.1 GNAT family acetyltransferase [Deinococcus aerophilus]